MTHDVFISHAAEDKQVADRVCQELEAAGVGCWIAPRDIPPGRDYDEAIVEAIGTSRVLLLILSAHANASPHVKREVQCAFAEGSPTRVIPFRIADVPLSKSLSYYLGSVQWIDASAPPLDEHLRRLVQYVRAELGAPGARPRPAENLDPQTARRPPDVAHPGPRHEPAPRPRTAARVALAAAALLAVAAVAFVAYRLANRDRPHAVVPSVNAVNTNQANVARPTPTPTPPPTATPTHGPTRQPNRNLNLRLPANLRGINVNRARPGN